MATDPDAPESIPIAILAKAPVAGFAKTRLIPRLGAQGAADLQAWMIRRAVTTALDAGIGPVSLWCAPNRNHALFRALAQAQDLALHDQAGPDLGSRMLAVFLAPETAGPMLLIGTDCPALTPSHLTACARALGQNDAVFLPAEDGGYALVGLRRAVPQIFEAMTWSTDTVMAETRERLARLGLTWGEPAFLWDVDVPADLDRLIDLRLHALAGQGVAPPLTPE